MFARPADRSRVSPLPRAPLAIRRERDGRLVAGRVQVAHAFAERLVGLIGRPGLAPGEGLLIHPCTSVHGFFMRFDIDVVHLDGDWGVLHVFRLKRNTAGPIVRGGRFALELAAGTCEAVEIRPGDRLVAESVV